MDTIELQGRRFRVEVEADEGHETPWDYEDGHGPVSDWTRRDKRPGERVLCSDRSSKRFYDFAQAVKTGTFLNDVKVSSAAYADNAVLAANATNAVTATNLTGNIATTQISGGDLPTNVIAQAIKTGSYLNDVKVSSAM